MPFYLSEKFQQSFLNHIINKPIEPLKSTDTVTVQCKCGKINQINVRSLYRKWASKTEYLCKSCHTKQYSKDPQKIQKFRESYSKITSTEEHKEKCSKAGKKAWEDPEVAKRIKEAISKDNHRNPKKVKAREIALKSLMQKTWFNDHMSEMNKLSVEKTKSNTEEFSEKALQKHEHKYDYVNSSYINNNTNIEIICPKHGSFLQTPHNHLQGKGCQKCSSIISNEHLKISQMLERGGIPHTNNERNVIKPLEIDIWIPRYKFGIETHGEYWHGIKPEDDPQTKERFKKLHQRKADMARDSQIKLYQFWQHELISKRKLCYSMIAYNLQKSQTVHARKMQIVELSNKQTKDFFDDSHMQGHRDALITYALVKYDIIMCALSFSRHNKHEWEIIRFANRIHMSVTGGFSRLLKHFKRERKPRQIMTFADKRFYTGGLYDNYFEEAYHTDPNYFYYNIRTSKILSRQQCQKHKLKNKIGDLFDPSLTAEQNMNNIGYIKIYDAGHVKYIWKQT